MIEEVARNGCRVLCLTWEESLRLGWGRSHVQSCCAVCGHVFPPPKARYYMPALDRCLCYNCIFYKNVKVEFIDPQVERARVLVVLRKLF